MKTLIYYCAEKDSMDNQTFRLSRQTENVRFSKEHILEEYLQLDVKCGKVNFVAFVKLKTCKRYKSSIPHVDGMKDFVV